MRSEAEEDASRIEGLLKGLGLPTRVEADGRVLLDALRKDKKKEGDRIHFVLLKGIGRAVIEAVSIEELAEVVIPTPS